MKLRQLFDVIVGKVERGEARQTSQLLHLESSGGVQGSNGDIRGASDQIKGRYVGKKERYLRCYQDLGQSVVGQGQGCQRLG